jgi:hypothetical protein
MEQTEFNTCEKLDRLDNNLSTVKLTTLDRVGSYDTISTEGSKSHNLEDLELLLEDLISGTKTLNDLPEGILQYSDEIAKIPQKPRKPEDWECCGTGCCPCIWDIYARDLEIHERSVQALCEKARESLDLLN